MTPEVINAIANVPFYVVALWLIVRQQGQIEKLTQTIIDLAEKHANDLIEMACTDIGKAIPNTGKRGEIPPSPTPGTLK